MNGSAGPGSAASGRGELAALAAASVRGDAEGIAGSVRAALSAGAPAAAVREALRMVHLFAGFPRALDALTAAAPEMPPPAPDPPEDRAAFAARGRALFGRVYGRDAARVEARLAALDPSLLGWVLEDAYGRVLARGVLSAADRERLAVVMLAAQGLRNQLPGHVRGALLCGATADEVEASLSAAAPWIAPEDLALARGALR